MHVCFMFVLKVIKWKVVSGKLGVVKIYTRLFYHLPLTIHMCKFFLVSKTVLKQLYDKSKTKILNNFVLKH